MSDREDPPLNPRRFPYETRSEAEVRNQRVLAVPADRAPAPRPAIPKRVANNTTNAPAAARLPIPEDGRLPDFKDQTRDATKPSPGNAQVAEDEEDPAPAQAIVEEEIRHHSVAVAHTPIAEVAAIQVPHSPEDEPKDTPPLQPQKTPGWVWPLALVVIVVVISVTVGVIMTSGSDSSPSTLSQDESANPPPTSAPNKADPTPNPSLPPITSPTKNPTAGPTLQPTPRPTLRPTPPPTPQPVTVSSPPQGPIVKVFETTAELYLAVDNYMEDPSLTANYGATMNDWDVSRIQVFDRVFDGSRNQADQTRWCEDSFSSSTCTRILFNEDLNKWNTSNAVSINAMFINAREFNGDISTWDVSRVASMDSLFDNARAFNRDLSQWNTSSVTRMREIFEYASAFNQPIGNWNVARVTTTGWMFHTATSFNQDLSAWDVGAVTDASFMFQSARALNQDLCAWRTKLPSTADVGNMFTSAGACPVDHSSTIFGGVGGTPVLGAAGQYWCHACNVNTFFHTTAELYQAVDNYMEDPSLTANYGATMNDWDVSRIQVFDRVFDGSRNQAGYETGWCEDGLTSSNCISMLFNEDLNQWNTSNAVSMNAMFVNAREFNGDISTWDVSRVTSMESLFDNARAFNRDLSQWNTGSVTSMQETFSFAFAFNQPIGNWNVARVTTTRLMFGSTTSFNQPIGNWNVARVTTTFFMFHTATSFNQDLSAWDVGAVTDASFMFYFAIALNQDLCAWRTKLPSTAYVYAMFRDADACPVDTSWPGGVGETPVLGAAGQYWCHECTV